MKKTGIIFIAILILFGCFSSDPFVINQFETENLVLEIQYNEKYDLEVWYYDYRDFTGEYALIYNSKGDLSKNTIKKTVITPLTNEGFYKGRILTTDNHTTVNYFSFTATLPAVEESRTYFADLTLKDEGNPFNVTYNEDTPYETCEIFDPSLEVKSSIDNMNCPTIFLHGFSANFGTWSDMIERIGMINEFNEAGYEEFDVIPEIVSPVHFFNFSYYYKDYNDWIEETATGEPFSYFQFGRIGDGNVSKDTDNYHYAGTSMFFTTPGLYYSRETYAERLAAFVDEVIKNIPEGNIKKVNIISHSMGGLVARAFIRWYGGAEKVNKIITIGTPNHGTRIYGAFLTVIGKGKEFRPELVEMSDIKKWVSRDESQRLSYPDYLAEPYETYGSEEYGIQYYTIAYTKRDLEKIQNEEGEYILRGVLPDDIIVDVQSVMLEGAIENIIIEDQYHCDSIKNSFREIVSIRSDETEYYIKKWLFGE